MRNLMPVSLLSLQVTRFSRILGAYRFSEKSLPLKLYIQTCFFLFFLFRSINISLSSVKGHFLQLRKFSPIFALLCKMNTTYPGYSLFFTVFLIFPMFHFFNILCFIRCPSLKISNYIFSNVQSILQACRIFIFSNDKYFEFKGLSKSTFSQQPFVVIVSGSTDLQESPGILSRTYPSASSIISIFQDPLFCLFILASFLFHSVGFPQIFGFLFILIKGELISAAVS